MDNSLIHAIVLIAAIVIPGGLIAYLAWRAFRVKKNPPTPAAAREAFFRKYPKQSLRAQSRKNRLDRLKTFRRKNAAK